MKKYYLGLLRRVQWFCALILRRRQKAPDSAGRRFYFIWILGIFLLACQTLLPAAVNPAETPLNTQAPLFPFLSAVSYPTTTPIFTPTEPSTATQTGTPTDTPTITPTFTASPSITPTWIRQGPYELTLPILLYHHVEISKHNSQYYVAPEKFNEEMKLLHDWGYTTITLDLLITAIKEGADLPPRPMLITFDDGQLSVYSTAFPIMQQYGFTGIVYIVGTYLDAPGLMTTDQVKQLVQAGWEVGSHSMRHKDLTTLDSKDQLYEISGSRKYLEERLGVPVKSFAYPFGFSDSTIVDMVYAAGYTSAMGLGYSHAQGTGNILMLQRRDVQGTYDVKKFASFLPWYGDPIFLPTDTPTPIPTPTRTPRPTKVK
jgi:peptidoglycan/xylan/chitin deacetylase (PgdA/CDA1 family)